MAVVLGIFFVIFGVNENKKLGWINEKILLIPILGSAKRIETKTNILTRSICFYSLTICSRYNPIDRLSYRNKL